MAQPTAARRRARFVFTDASVADDGVRRVARLVSYELDASIDYPRQFVGDVEITLADGRVLREELLAAVTPSRR